MAARVPSRTRMHVVDLWTMNQTNGVNRPDIEVGKRVLIVQKQDQASGRTTEGIVKDILTRSGSHPHRIKVRLVTGEIGRVKALVPGDS